MKKGNSQEILLINKDSRVLFIYPHPDDESYCNAGLLQKLAKSHTYTFILCLTKGGASTLAFNLVNGEELTNKREEEFKSVVKFLGVNSYRISDLDDGKIPEQQNQVVELIKNVINEIKPTHLVTYEPCGIYGHPDHITVSNICTELAKQNNLTLIYTTVAPNYKSSPRDLNMAKDPSTVKPINPNAALELSFSEFINKLKALNMYKSQISVTDDFKHKVYQVLQMLKEYYFVLESKIV